MSKIKLKKGFYEGKDLGYSQLFAKNPSLYARFNLKGHNGIDIPTPVGTKLFSAINGTVVESTTDAQGYGIYVKIDNEYCGVLYAHLRELSLKVGDKVKAGDFVGFSGNTGNSTGPHLHFGVHPIPRDRTNGYAGYIDPLGSQIEWVNAIKQEDSCEKELEEMRESRNKWKEEVSTLKEEIKALKKELNGCNTNSKKNESEMADLKTENTFLKGTIENLKVKQNIKDRKPLDDYSTKELITYIFNRIWR